MINVMQPTLGQEELNAIQKVFESIREHGMSEGKHISQNERSLLDAFQTSAKKVMDKESGLLVPFDSFYATAEEFIDYDIKTVFPGHRGLSNKTLEQRVHEIRDHHERRLNEIREVLREHPDANAYEVASHLTWSLHGATWETAPKSQQWFAVGETIAHMDHLREWGG